MAVDISPTARGMLALTVVILAVAVWLFSSGSLLTLLFILGVLALIAYLLWALGLRLTRRLAGM